MQARKAHLGALCLAGKLRSMAGKRHHTIPQFLTRGFASSRRGRETYVWRYTTEKGIELNTLNVAAEGYFYGKPDETDLDERITKLETPFAELVESLRAGTSMSPAPVDGKGIPHLIAHLALRTRQVRQSLSAMTLAMIEEVGKHLTDRQVLIAMIANGLSRDGEMRDNITNSLLSSGLPAERVHSIMQRVAEHKREVAEMIIADPDSDFGQLVAEQVDLFKRVQRDAIKDGHIKALSSNLEMTGRVEVYTPFNWFTVRSPLPLILGDSVCIFETSGPRRFRPIDLDATELQRIYLPISSDAVLVGTRTSKKPVVDFARLNKAAARCSCEFFVSSRQLSMDSHLIRGLGLWAGVLNDSEVKDLLKDTKRTLVE